ncbi:hypothetical protein DAPPUDRAFT_334492 [Daphnia pulex]|uniref:HAT C-terminal dimerisation domain-containing protein n=1 Tax=Daphnia pulex TaxID=6669 RepID=E9HVP2_DAPPU|nr:hypothetical protein DAPPUDRAFT_334492 [Daphnia pulex]|eukprot:EFX64190.1 hypothetical protein DAPPUDRAFT_334492 [Daphnia pulex]
MDAEDMARVSQIIDMEDEKDEVNEINEAASRTAKTFDLLQTEDYDPYIIQPTHIRCASHTLNFIASADTCLTKVDVSSFPKKNAKRNAMSKITELWKKIGRSITAVEQAKEALGVAIKTPCATRFAKLFEDPLAVLAAITHPFFKSNWIEDEA